MPAEVFDSVAWDDIRRALANKPKMYQLWYGKQVSGYCGTGERISMYDKEADDKCPNCGKAKEDAAHLNVLLQENQSLLLLQFIKIKNLISK